MSVIITKNGKDAKKIDRTKFVNEEELQEYLYENPDIVPVYEIDEDIRLVILAREFSTNSGPIDALGIDANGDIYIVETKLYKNPDKRTVIAQAIDYGASMWAYYNDFTDFITRLDSEANKKFGMSLNRKVSEFFEMDEDQVEQLFDTMKENLNKGIFKFVVLMDELVPRLKDLIRFINQNSQFDVYAVELEYYKFEQHELMIPKIYGAEVKKDIDVSSKRTPSQRRSWNEESFFSELSENVESGDFQNVKNLYDFFKEDADSVDWGTGSSRGSFNVKYKSICPRAIITVWTDGELTFQHGWLDGSEKADLLRESLKKKMKEKFEVPEGTYSNNYSIEEWGNHSEWLCKVISGTVEETLSL